MLEETSGLWLRGRFRYTVSMDPAFIALLRCTSCGSTELTRGVRCAQCSCGLEVVEHDGYVDLIDASKGAPAASSAEQRMMESDLVANLYERFWRPTFVRLMAGKEVSANTGGFSGEFFIHKNALSMEDREGPWLDLSSGSGLYTRAMAASASNQLVVGVDVSRAMLEAAVTRVQGYTNIVLARADAHDLPFKDACFGGVRSWVLGAGC